MSDKKTRSPDPLDPAAEAPADLRQPDPIKPAEPIDQAEHGRFRRPHGAPEQKE